jgi:hypothetical protein
MSERCGKDSKGQSVEDVVAESKIMVEGGRTPCSEPNGFR